MVVVLSFWVRQGYIRLHWFVGVFACMNAIQDGASNCWGRRNEQYSWYSLGRTKVHVQSTIEKMFGNDENDGQGSIGDAIKKIPNGRP